MIFSSCCCVCLSLVAGILSRRERVLNSSLMPEIQKYNSEKYD
jgi:hypothetical protein